jgi:hypothetical protein
MVSGYNTIALRAKLILAAEFLFDHFVSNFLSHVKSRIIKQ